VTFTSCKFFILFSSQLLVDKSFQLPELQLVTLLNQASIFPIILSWFLACSSA